MINLIEITEKNVIQIRDLNDIEGITSFSRRTTNSEQDLSSECEMVQDMAILFPLIAPVTHDDGAIFDVSLIKFACNDPANFVYKPVKHAIRGGEIVASQKEPAVQVNALTDLSELPAKVQALGNYLFTDEVKAAYLASLG
tara:strand:+ start:187 stop:609 length:423 start_codon:yes stop_codon:yes gene_type:complete